MAVIGENCTFAANVHVCMRSHMYNYNKATLTKRSFKGQKDGYDKE